MPTERITFDALPVSYSDTTFYVMVVPVSVLEVLCRVSRADEDPAQGYQRLLGVRRAEAIARYLDEGHVIPGALICNAMEEANARFEQGKLSLDRVRGSFVLLDGQHRFFGAAKSEVDALCFPVCVFIELTHAEEVQLFLDVNTTQRGVPKTLQLEVMKFQTERESPDGVRQRLFEEFNTRPTSPLSGKLSPTRSVRGKLSHVPFKKAMDPLLDWPFFWEASFDVQYKLVENYLVALEATLSDIGQDSKLTNAAFFQAAFSAFREVASVVFEKHSDYKPESLMDVLSPLGGVDWELHSGTNKQAIKGLSNEIIRLVATQRRATADLV